MNVIQKIVQQYNGEYIEFPKKEMHTHAGKHGIQPQLGKFEIEGRKFSISKNENIGVSFNGNGINKAFFEPYKIFLYLDKKYYDSINIYPKNNLNKIIAHLMSLIGFHKAKPIHKEYYFKGNMSLIEALIKQSEFTKNLTNTRLFISISKDHAQKIMLIEEKGELDLVNFIKYSTLLSIIEKQINYT
ncbi:MAG: sulfite reductase alpha subunit-like flavoprotein [Flavobacteriales bacterium]|jgi:sulfite reductase alpha subunit-like flavoprotein